MFHTLQGQSRSTATEMASQNPLPQQERSGDTGSLAKQWGKILPNHKIAAETVARFLENTPRFSTHYIASSVLLQHINPKSISKKRPKNLLQLFSPRHIRENQWQAADTLLKVLADKASEQTLDPEFLKRSKEDRQEGLKASFFDVQNAEFIDALKKNPIDLPRAIKNIDRQTVMLARAAQHIPENNLESGINQCLVIWQHRAFLNGISWSAIKRPMAHLLFEKFQSTKVTSEHQLKKIIDNCIQRAPGYSVSEQGGIFKSYKRSSQSRAPLTQVRSVQGRIFELVHTITEADSQKLYMEHGIQVAGEHISLGSGGFSKVRLAKDLATGEFVAVKKFAGEGALLHIEDEIAIFKQLQKSEHLIEMVDYAILTNQRGHNKNYLFIELAGTENLKKTIESLYETKKLNTDFKNEITYHLLRAVQEMHANQVWHRDIKPENFCLSTSDPFNLQLKLIDYGIATLDSTTTEDIGTVPYQPPEALAPNSRYTKEYTAEKHDIFSTGLVLFDLLRPNNSAKSGRGSLVLAGKKFPVHFDKHHEPYTTEYQYSCQGLASEKNLDCNTLDELVAQMLNCNPAKRPTIEEIFQTPYMQNLERKCGNKIV